MRNGITSRRKRESLPVIYALLGAYLQPCKRKLANLFSSVLSLSLSRRRKSFANSTPGTPQRLGPSISANGDYIFRLGTHRRPTYAPMLLSRVPLLMVLARTTRDVVYRPATNAPTTNSHGFASRAAYPFLFPWIRGKTSSRCLPEDRQVIPADPSERCNARGSPLALESSGMEIPCHPCAGFP